MLLMTTCSGLEENLGCSSRETHSGNTVSVATKSADVLLGPCESLLNIPYSSVRDTALMQQSRAIGDSSHSQSVVVRDEDEVGR